MNGTDVASELTVEWFDPANDKMLPDRAVAGGAKRRFTAPFTGEAVLYLATARP